MTFTSKELRKKYIDFFASQSHVEIESSSTVPPEEDQTVLFTTAGMQQFVPNLMGKPHPKGTKLMSVQKCVRTVDIDDVGDNRHLTFFEMLGNWSLGDYFKKEAIEWSYRFLIEELKIPKEKLWVTIYGGDEVISVDNEAREFWKNMGIPEDKIVPIGPPEDPEKRKKKGRGDNFWGPAGPTGPCGPSTEMFIWLGEGEPKKGQNPATDEDNFIEVWNDVFMEFLMDEKGEIEPLSQKNVDTGMGLERLTMIMQGKTTVFETDVYEKILKKIETITDKKYPPYSGDLNENNEVTRAMRVIADHVRTSSHLIADGVAPSNEGRGYVLRRLLRRAVRYGKKLGMTSSFLGNIANVYLDDYSSFYPELIDRKTVILDTLKIEEENFLKTLERGEKIFEEKVANFDGQILSGTDAFMLFDTYGFPFDLTKELAKEKGLSIDEEGFQTEMKEQRERSRSSAQFDRKTDDEDFSVDLETTIFTGYETPVGSGKILRVENGEKVKCILDTTPFYAESGGQVGDMGMIKTPNGEMKVESVKKTTQGVFIHFGKMISGKIKEGEMAELLVDRSFREKTKRHHSAAHLLHAALHEVLGDHVQQAGSLVDDKRTRFDFSHPRAMSSEQIRAVEECIAQWVFEAHPVIVEEMPIDEAKEKGAQALFSEKYGERVRTIKMGTRSFELCGGTHVSNTSEIGVVKIISESSVASGIRRIELVCGPLSQEKLFALSDQVDAIATMLKVPSDKIAERLDSVFAEKKKIEQELNEAKNRLIEYQSQEFFDRRYEKNGVTIICEILSIIDMKLLGSMARTLVKKGGDTVVLFGEDGGLVVATQKGTDAKILFNSITKFAGGKGGGSPEFVQGKGVNIELFDDIRKVVDNFFEN